MRNAKWQEKAILTLNNWAVTDDDCCQCCRELSDGVFEMIQATKLGDNSFVVTHGCISKDDYTVTDVEDVLNFFSYDGIDDFTEKNEGHFDWQLIAEMLFESEVLDVGYGDFDEFKTLEEAVAKIKEVTGIDYINPAGYKEQE